MSEKIVIGIAVLIILGVLVGVYYAITSLKSEERKGSSPESGAVAAPEASALNKENMNHLITIKSNFGEIQFETYDNDAPKTAKNFIDLANKGFYNNLIFHRVIKDFMIQGGDPKGDGTGGPGYKFEDELDPNTESYKQGYVKGVVAMANAGPNTNGSQFFIMLKDTALPHNYTIFGKVVKGQEVVDAIGNVQTGANDKPLKPVLMEKVSVEVMK